LTLIAETLIQERTKKLTHQHAAAKSFEFYVL